MDDLIFVKSELQKLTPAQLRDVEGETAVPFGTVYKIYAGTTKNPRYDTVSALAKYFRGKLGAAA